jgi:hypothetical protein
MADFDDVNVSGSLSIQGLQAARVLAACFLIGDPVTPFFLSNVGFEPTIIRNGVGDYEITFLVSPGPQVAAATSYVALDGIPGVVTVIPTIGLTARALLTHLDGTPVDTAFMLTILRNG